MFLAAIVAVHSCASVSKSSEGFSEDDSPVNLWVLHCSRCHNIPSPSDYNNKNWELIANHMKVRASISETEINKILSFLKSAQ